MMRVRLLPLILGLALLGAGAPAHAQNGDAPISLSGTITGTTYDEDGGQYCILIYPPPPECSGSGVRGGVTVEARSVVDPGTGQPIQEQPQVAPIVTTSAPDGSYTLGNVPVGLWRVSAHIQVQTFSSFAPTPFDTIRCRADSPDGPTSKVVSIDFGQTVHIDWFCGSSPGLGSLFPFPLPFPIPGFGDLPFLNFLFGLLPLR